MVLSANGNGSVCASSTNANAGSISMVLSANGNGWVTVDVVGSIVLTIIRGSTTGTDALVKKDCASTAIPGCV